MTWFKRQSGDLDATGEKKVRTEGLWVKCESCRQIIWKKDLEENLNVCPKCDKHFRIDARTRLAQLLDDNQYEVFDGNLVSTDPLKFTDLKSYSSRLQQAQAETGLKDAVINARGKLNGRPVWRNDHPGRRALNGEQGASHHCFGFGRGAHDGRRHQLDAVGKDFGRAGPVGRSPRALYLGSYRSNHRRSDCVLRHARRLKRC